jgi:FRG domain
MNEVTENTVWGYFRTTQKKVSLLNKATDARKAPGHRVKSYRELATKIAELQFMNRDLVLMFRGQNGDYRNSRGNTTLKASLFRSERGQTSPPSAEVLKERFERLQRAERELISRYEAGGFIGKERLQRYRILRWAILQHYEVCPTPLLDVTHSLRIASTFATMGTTTDAYLYVLGVPNLAGAITASAEAGLQIIRLSSVCPPSALRPHFQEGYLLGEYPELLSFDDKLLMDHYEVDFGRRLIAKFVFDPQKLWSDPNFTAASKEAIYPAPGEDPLLDMTEQIKAALV